MGANETEAHVQLLGYCSFVQSVGNCKHFLACRGTAARCTIRYRRAVLVAKKFPRHPTHPERICWDGTSTVPLCLLTTLLPTTRQPLVVSGICEDSGEEGLHWRALCPPRDRPESLPEWSRGLRHQSSRYQHSVRNGPCCQVMMKTGANEILGSGGSLL